MKLKILLLKKCRMPSTEPRHRNKIFVKFYPFELLKSTKIRWKHPDYKGRDSRIWMINHRINIWQRISIWNVRIFDEKLARIFDTIIDDDTDIFVRVCRIFTRAFSRSLCYNLSYLFILKPVFLYPFVKTNFKIKSY